jgi:UDPglucose--hexose-1-phosphate uridylyltransferase
VHSPRHVRSFAELEDGEVRLVAEAWARRVRDTDASYVHALVNEGRAAGASLAHSHSQLVWMGERPPAAALEDEGRLDEAVSTGATIETSDAVAAVCPAAARVPYESLIAPTRPGAEIAEGLRLLRSLVRRLRAVEGPVPWNAWLHSGTSWHIELVPRLTVLAGIELGAGIYVNTLAPEDAARALREAAP